MIKQATCQVTFTFNWSEEDEANYFADESHFAELYLSSGLKESEFVDLVNAEVECIRVGNVEESE